MERMTAAEYREMVEKQQRLQKYHNIKTEIDGITFDSRAEANRYMELCCLLRAGEIQGFTRQISFILSDGLPAARIRYVADFLVRGKDGSIWVEDVKGHETKEFKIKRKLWAEAFPWLELRVIR